MSQFLSAQDKVLIFHKTNGFRHGSINNGINMIKNLGTTNGLWTADDSQNANVFTAENLAQYKVVIWCNTSGNNLLNASQRAAFENYIQNGGGFVGIHAATDTYRDKSWPFYNDLVGGIVQTNPNHTRNNHNNTMDIVAGNNEHPSISFLGETWNKVEEYYYWKNNGGQLFSGNKNLLIVRETTGPNGRTNDYDEPRPMAWFKEFEGGRSFYTALGHNSSDYTNSDFMKHVEGGIKWAGNFDDVTPPPLFEQIIPDGDYYIQDTTENLALETDTDRNAYTNLFDATNEGQIWNFEHQDNNIYKIKNKLTDWFLETPQALCDDGVNVATWRASTQSHHTFKVIKTGNNFILEPGHCEGKALSANRTNAQENASLKEENGPDSTIIWKINKTDETTLSINKIDLIVSNITATPNPVKNQLSINGLNSKIAYGLQIQIFDIQGKKVGSQAISVSVNTIDFSKLASGTYFIQFSNESIPTKQIIKL